MRVGGTEAAQEAARKRKLVSSNCCRLSLSLFVYFLKKIMLLKLTNFKKRELILDMWVIKF
jgi:hypothetical protein